MAKQQLFYVEGTLPNGKKMWDTDMTQKQVDQIREAEKAGKVTNVIVKPALMSMATLAKTFGGK